MNKPGFTWVTPILSVIDLSRSLEHYESTLGFDVEWKWSEGEEFEEESKPTFACVIRGDCSIFLCEQGQGNPGSWICLNVRDKDELDDIYAEYKRSSANVAQKPTDYPWGMREMIVKDLDGNVFRIGCGIDDHCSKNP